MFLLYAVVIGLALGLLLGGRAGRPRGASRSAGRRAIVGGLLVQVALFSPPVAARVGDLGPPIYVASTMLVVAAVLRNLALPGMALVAAGAACNLAAIVANGGSMPASRGRDRADGRRAGRPRGRLLQQLVAADPGLWFLTDIFAMPRALPFANVFSVGDLLIGAGIAVVIVLAMRSARRPRLAAGPATRPTPDRRRRERSGARWCAAEPPTNGRSGQYLWGSASVSARP